MAHRPDGPWRRLREHWPVISAFTMVVLVSIAKAVVLERSLIWGGVVPAGLWILMVVYFVVKWRPPDA